MPAPTIFLIGFMGSGKTTLGKKLAAKLGYRFVDLDAVVVAENQSTGVAQLIDVKGIDYFRRAENEVLKKLDLQNAVVSTGGGTPCYFDSLEWMKAHGTVVYLDVDEKSLFNRLQTTNLHERPLLRNLDEVGLKTFIHEKLQERLPYYRQAHISFNPVNQKLEELVGLLAN